MKFTAILNQDGGTLRTMDLDAFAERLAATLSRAGHSVETRIVAGGEVTKALAQAAREDGLEAVLAGGGDGTVSAAAAALADSGKVLAVLPAGTMNLFARSLGIPLDLDEAVRCFASGKVRAVDVASVNGRVFVHQFSVGLHAKMVATREKMSFSSRVGKMIASTRAAIAALVRPPYMTVRIGLDGAEIVARTSGIGVTNNLFGEGHLPYADDPDGGTLGIYVTTSRGPGGLLRFMVNMMLGRWKANSQVEVHETEEARLRFGKVRSRHRAVVDGELIPLEPDAHVRIHKGALLALVPADRP